MSPNQHTTISKPRTVDDYLALPYRIEITREDDCWVARVPDLPGLVAASETWEELRDQMDDAMRAWITVALERDRPVPEPSTGDGDHSGELRVRLGRKLYAEAARLASRSDVSLNTLIVTAVAKEVGRHEPNPGT